MHKHIQFMPVCAACVDLVYMMNKIALYFVIVTTKPICIGLGCISSSSFSFSFRVYLYCVVDFRWLLPNGGYMKTGT